MSVWDAARPPFIQQDAGIAAASYYLIGNLFPGANTNISKAISLYRFLLQNKNVPAAELRKRIVENGKPLFSEKDMKEVLEVIQRNADTKFSRRLVPNRQVGGANTTATPGAPAPTTTNTQPPNAAPAPGAAAPRPEFWDMLIEKVTHPITSRIPSKFDGLIWYIFILQHLEEVDFIGPVISTALDSITLSLPIFAEMGKMVTQRILMLVPVPYAGLAGEVLGTGIAFLILSVAIVLNIARHKFGSAFKVALAAIPFMGDMLMDIAVNIETAAMRYEKNRARILASIDKYSPHTEDVLSYWTPTVQVVEGDPVFFDLNKVKMDLINKAAEELGIDEAMSIVGDSSLVPTATPGLPTVPGAGAIPPGGNAAATAANTTANTNSTLQTTATPAAAATNAAPPPSAPAPATVTTATNAAAPKKGGAKRKTRRVSRRR